jgi:hypothetical protein
MKRDNVLIVTPNDQIDIRLVQIGETLCTVISGATLPQIKRDPVLEKAVKKQIERLIAVSKTLGWDI